MGVISPRRRANRRLAAADGGRAVRFSCRRAPRRDRAQRVKRSLSFVEARERNGRKVHGPEAIIDFFEADVFPGERRAEKRRGPAPGDLAGVGDAPDFEMPGIRDGRQHRGQPTRRGLIPIRRHLIVERFVRPLRVVFATEAIDASLLGAQMPRRWTGGETSGGSRRRAGSSGTRRRGLRRRTPPRMSRARAPRGRPPARSRA